MNKHKRKMKALIVLISVVFGTICCEKKEKLLMDSVNLDALDDDENGISLLEVFELDRIQALETSEDAFMTFPAIMRVIEDSLLLIKTSSDILLFNIKDGLFYTQVAKKGQAPGEFYNSLKNVSVPIKDRSIFALRDANTIVEYFNQENAKVAFKVPSPSDNQGFEQGLINGYALMPDGKDMIGYIMNMSGDESVKLVRFDKDGNVLELYKNHLKYRKKVGLLRAEVPSFHYFDGSLFFKETYNDTLFRVEKTALVPEYVFQSNNQSPIYNEQDFLTRDERKEVYFVSNISQDEDFIYFKYTLSGSSGFGLFNKTDKSTKYIDTENNTTSLNAVAIPPVLVAKQKLIFAVEYWQLADLVSSEKLKSDFGITNLMEEHNPFLMIFSRKKLD